MSHRWEGSARTLASLPEVESWGGAGMLSAVTQCSWPEGFPMSISGVARSMLVHHVQSTHAASALYAAQRGVSTLGCCTS